MKITRHTLFYVSILLFVGVIIYARLCTKEILTSKFYLDMTGWEIFSTRSLTRGEMPLWNPYQNCGQPFVADVRTCFYYPVSAILRILPLNLAYSTSILLHLAIAGVGAFALARRLGIRNEGALFTGLAYGANGHILDLLFQGELFEMRGYAWLPWVLWTAEGVCIRKDWSRTGTGFLLTWFLVFSCGSADMVIRLLLMVAVYVAIRCGLFRLKVDWRMSARFILFFALAFSISAILLLPQVEFEWLSTNPLQDGTTHRDVFRPLALLDFISPDFFGSTADQRVLYGEDSPIVYSGTHWGSWSNYKHIYSGLPILVMIIFAARKFARSRRDPPTPPALGFAAVAVSGLFLSLGGCAFLTTILPGAIGDPIGRHPVLFTMFWLLPLHLAAGAGLHQLLESLPAERRLPLMPRSALIPILVGIVLLLLRMMSPDLLNTILIKMQAFQYQYENNGRWYIAVPFSLIHLLGACLLLYGVWSLYYNGKLRAGGIAWGIILVLAFDLWTYGQRYVGAGKGMNDYTNRGDFIAFTTLMKSDAPIPSLTSYGRIVNQFRNGLSPNLGFIYGVEMPEDSGFPKIERFQSLLDQLYATRESRTSYWTRNGLSQYPHLPEVIMGVQAVTDSNIIDQSVYSKNIPNLIQFTPLPFPAAGFVGSSSPTSYIASQDPWHQVVIEATPGNRSLIQAEEPIRAVMVREGHQGRRLITVDMPAEGYLYLSDAYYPGWVARDADGTEYPIVPANHAFRAVKLPPGKHRITFTYEPASFRIGKNITLGALLVWLVVLLWEARLSRRIEPRRTHEECTKNFKN